MHNSIAAHPSVRSLIGKRISRSSLAAIILRLLPSKLPCISLLGLRRLLNAVVGVELIKLHLVVVVVPAPQSSEEKADDRALNNHLHTLGLTNTSATHVDEYARTRSGLVGEVMANPNRGAVYTECSNKSWGATREAEKKHDWGREYKVDRVSR